jgi:hypothetical protein
MTEIIIAFFLEIYDHRFFEDSALNGAGIAYSYKTEIRAEVVSALFMVRY